MHGKTSRVGGLLEAISQRKQLRLTEGRTKEREGHRQLVPSEPRRHDEVRKAGEIGEVNGRARCSARWIRRCGQERWPFRQSRVDYRIQTLRPQDTFDN